MYRYSQPAHLHNFFFCFFFQVKFWHAYSSYNLNRRHKSSIIWMLGVHRKPGPHYMHWTSMYSMLDSFRNCILYACVGLRAHARLQCKHTIAMYPRSCSFTWIVQDRSLPFHFFLILIWLDANLLQHSDIWVFLNHIKITCAFFRFEPTTL